MTAAPRTTNTTQENPMSTELAPATTTTGGLPALTFNDEQIAVIRDQICKPKDRDATPAELALFLNRCQRTGLDPIAGQIVSVFRWDGRAKAEKMAIQVTVDGQRAIANSTGEYLGSDREWCGPDGQWVDVWLDPDKEPAAARVTVRRQRGNNVIEQKAVVAWHEAKGSEDKAGHFWQDQPAHMLAKTAEARALKIAFPGEIGGMQEAASEEPTAVRGVTADGEEIPAWAMPANADQWKAAGQVWFELSNELDVGREATEDAWRTMLRAFDGQKPVGFARALADGLAELIIHIPTPPPSDKPVEGSATEEQA